MTSAANDPAVMHALYPLADYPVLASLAQGRTKASKLDGRACRYIYEAALPRIDWQAVSARERAFMRSLGIALTTAELIAVLQALPPDLPVMLPTEGGIDHALSVRVAEVARHSREWASTPVGQYRELPDDDASGEPFRVVLIDLEPEPT